MNTDRLKLEVKRALGPFLLLLLLCIAGAVTAADVVSNLAGQKPWIGYRDYRVAFSDGKNVVPGRAELRIAGVKAGAITHADVVGGQAVLTLSIEDKYAPLYKNAVVRIRPVTPLEDMYVDITSRGTPAAGPLTSHDILPTSQTVSPVEVGRVLDMFDPHTRGRLSVLLDELGRGLTDRGAALRASFQQLAPFLSTTAQMSSALHDQRVSLARLVHNFGGIMQALSTRDQQLTSFVGNADSTLGVLAAHDRAFSGTIAALPPLVTNMETTFSQLRTTEGVLDPALRSLTPAAQALPGGLEALTTFARQAMPALTSLRPAVDHLQPLARTLAPTAKDLRGAFQSLSPEAPQLDRSTRLAAIPSCETYAAQFVNRVISMTKFGDSRNNIANARANVRVDFHTFGEQVKPPNWRIVPPCFVPGGSK